MGTSAFDRIFDQLERRPAQPTRTAFDSIFDELEQKQTPAGQLGASVRSATILRPSDAQDAYALSSKTGVPIDVAIRNLDRLRQESGAKDFDPEAFARRYPITTQTLVQDSTLATLAQDEYEQLGFLERVIGTWRLPTLKDIDRAMTAPGTVAPLQTRRGILQEEWRRALDMDAARVGILPPSQRAPYRALLAEIDRERETPLPESAGGLESFLRASARIAPSLAETVKAGGVGAGVGAVVGGTLGLVGGLAGAVAGAVTGAKAGGMLNSIATAFLMEAGNQSLELEKKTDAQGRPMDPNIAYGYGLVYGTGSAALEMVGLNLVASPFKAIARNVFGEATAAALRTPTTRGALVNGARAWATAVAGETVTEVAQQGLSLIVESDAANLSNIRTGTELEYPTGDRVRQELWATAVETAMGMALLGVPGGVGVTLQDAARAEKAEARRAWMGEVVEALNHVPTTAGVSDAMRNVLATDIRESGAPQTMFVPSERLVVLLQENEVPLAQFADAVGVPVQDIEAAMAGGADVAVPTDAFLTNVVKTDLGAAMLDDIRYQPGELTAREAKEMAKAIEKDFGPVREAMQQQVDVSSLAEGEQRVFDDIRKRLEDAGTPGNRLDIEAELASRVYIVQARKWAEANPEHRFADAWTLYQSRNLRILGPERAEPLLGLTRQVQEAEKARDYETASRVRDQMRRLLDESAEIRAALEMADQTQDVRDANGRLRRNLRKVSDESLVLEYIRLRDMVSQMQGELSALDAQETAALAERGNVATAEETVGALEDAGMLANIPSVADAETFEGKLAAYRMHQRQMQATLARYGRSVPRLERELTARGITEPDAYAEERGYGLDASFDPDALTAMVEQGQAVSDAFVAGQANAIPVRFGAWDEPRPGDEQIRGYRIRSSTTATERRLVQELQRRRGMAVSPDSAGLWPLFGFWDMRDAWLSLREQGELLPLEQAAFHGSPYVFDRFDLSKIGTGEGAQAYGWGLYFAESENVGEMYRRNLTGTNFPPRPDAFTVNGVSYASEGRGDSRVFRKGDGEVISKEEYGQAFAAAQEDYEQRSRNLGALYRVDIPDEAVARMLDWDKPLSEQAVSGLIAEMVSASPASTMLEQDALADAAQSDPSWTGERVYRRISEWLGGDEAASKALLAAGIPGIKYLDAGSRGAIKKPQWASGADQSKYVEGTLDAAYFEDFFTAEEMTAKMEAEARRAEASGESDWAQKNRDAIRAIRAGDIVVPATRNLVVFDDALVTITHRNGEPVTAQERADFLAQEQTGRERARPNAYLLPFNRERIVGLTSTANASSFLHEMAHEYLFLLADTARMPDAPAAIREDLDATLQWLGVSSVQDIGEAQQERFARTFESYLQSGQAPSAALTRAFHRLRVWLTALYESFLQAEYPVTDDIRRVFDRMLATDAEIADLRSQPESRPLFENGEAAEMTEAQWDAYVAAFDLRDADVAGRVLRDVLVEDNQARKRAWEEQESAVRERVTDEVFARPEMQAVRYFRTGRLPDGTKVEKPVRLSREALVTLFDESVLRKLPHGVYQKEGGLAPDAAAAMFGVEDGVALVSALQQWENPETVIAREVDAVRQREYPDLLDDSPALAEAVRRAAERAQADAPILAELKALGRRLGIEAPNVVAVKAAARDIVGKMRVRDIRPDVFRQAERSAAIKAERAYRGGDFVQAEFHKRQQLLNRILARTAQEAVDLADKAQAFARRMDGRTAQEHLGFAGQAHVDAMDALLDAYEFRRVPLRELDMRAAIAEFVKEQERVEAPVLIAPEVVEASQVVNYRSLPFAELADVYAAMKQVYETARARSKAVAAEEQMAFEDAKGSIVAGIESHRALIGREWTARTDRTVLDRAGDVAERINGAHIKPEVLMRILDGDVFDGPVQRVLFRPAAQAQTNQSQMLSEATVALREVWAEIPEAERKQWAKRTVQLPGRRRPISKATAIAIALNSGNAGNTEALLDASVDGDRAFTNEQIRAAHAALTATDWRAVQKVWDYLDTFWPAIAELERRMTGVTPEKVEAVPLTVTTADGQTIQLRGGYYPLKYDGRFSAVTFGRQQLALEAAAEGKPVTRGSRAHTRHGHTEARVGSGGQAVDLSLDVLPRHVYEVIHDLTHREMVYDAQRILLDKDVERSITLAAGPTAYRSLLRWVKRMAEGDELPKNDGERILLHARAGVTVANMGLKLTTSIMQLSGVLPAMDVVGVKWMRRGATEFVRRGGYGLIKDVQALSGEMRDRVTNMDRDMRAVAKGGTMQEREVQWFILTQMSDQVVATITWWAQYQRSLSEGVAQAEAIKQADSAVRISQGAGAPKDLAAAQGGTTLARLFTMFSSYAFTLYGLFYRANKNVKEARWGKGRWLASMLFIWLLPSVLEPLMVGRGPDEDDDPEDKALWWLWQVASYPAQTVMGVRDLIRGIGPDGYEVKLTPLVDVAEATGRAAMALPDLFGADNGLSRSEVRALLDATGYWGQLPSRQLWISGSYLYDWMMGYIEPETVREAYEGFAFGKR